MILLGRSKNILLDIEDKTDFCVLEKAACWWIPRRLSAFLLPSPGDVEHVDRDTEHGPRKIAWTWTSSLDMDLQHWQGLAAWAWKWTWRNYAKVHNN
jgi:hypothetical protein